MRIVFIGTVESSYVALKTLIDLHEDVVGVITCERSSFNSDFKDLTPLCRHNGVPYRYCSGKLDNDEKTFIRNCSPDVIFCVGWSYLLSQDILNIPQYGCIGFHPAPLPKGRGRHPIIWSILLGLDKTASCFFILEDGADTGAVVSERLITIDSTETSKSLMSKVLEEIPDQVGEIVKHLHDGYLPRKVQNELLMTTWRKRQKSDGRIDFRMSVIAIERLIRALTLPYPGAHIEHKGYEYTIMSYKNYNKYIHYHEPGKVLSMKENLITVACFDGDITFANEKLAQDVKPGDYFI